MQTEGRETRVSTGDVPDLIRRYFDGDLSGGTDLSRATGGVVIPQTAVLYIKGTARFADFPKYRTIAALAGALGIRHEAMLRAFAISGRELDMTSGETDLTRELRMQPGMRAFDNHPWLIASIARGLADIAEVLAVETDVRAYSRLVVGVTALLADIAEALPVDAT